MKHPIPHMTVSKRDGPATAHKWRLAYPHGDLWCLTLVNLSFPKTLKNKKQIFFLSLLCPSRLVFVYLNYSVRIYSHSFAIISQKTLQFAPCNHA